MDMKPPFLIPGGALVVKITAAGLLILSGSALAVTAEESPRELSAQVMAAESAFARTMVERDLDGFLSHIADEAVFFGSRGAQRGIAAVKERWSPFFEGPEPPFSWVPEVVEVLDSGGLAHSSGPVLDSQGVRIGTFNSIWRLEPDGRWKVVFDKGSPVCDEE